MRLETREQLNLLNKGPLSQPRSQCCPINSSVNYRALLVALLVEVRLRTNHGHMTKTTLWW